MVSASELHLMTTEDTAWGLKSSLGSVDSSHFSEPEILIYNCVFYYLFWFLFYFSLFLAVSWIFFFFLQLLLEIIVNSSCSVDFPFLVHVFHRRVAVARPSSEHPSLVT